MPIKTLGSLGKIRVGRVTGNTHIFFGLILLGAQNAKLLPKSIYAVVNDLSVRCITSKR